MVLRHSDIRVLGLLPVRVVTEEKGVGDDRGSSHTRDSPWGFRGGHERTGRLVETKRSTNDLRSFRLRFSRRGETIFTCRGAVLGPVICDEVDRFPVVPTSPPRSGAPTLVLHYGLPQDPHPTCPDRLPYRNRLRLVCPESLGAREVTPIFCPSLTSSTPPPPHFRSR